MIIVPIGESKYLELEWSLIDRQEKSRNNNIQIKKSALNDY